MDKMQELPSMEEMMKTIQNMTKNGGLDLGAMIKLVTPDATSEDIAAATKEVTDFIEPMVDTLKNGIKGLAEEAKGFADGLADEAKVAVDKFTEDMMKISEEMKTDVLENDKSDDQEAEVPSDDCSEEESDTSHTYDPARSCGWVTSSVSSEDKKTSTGPSFSDALQSAISVFGLGSTIPNVENSAFVKCMDIGKRLMMSDDKYEVDHSKFIAQFAQALEEKTSTKDDMMVVFKLSSKVYAKYLEGDISPPDIEMMIGIMNPKITSVYIRFSELFVEDPSIVFV